MRAYVQAVDDALGAAKSRIWGKQALMDANNRGIGQLVSPNMNEESAGLKALRARQQLAAQPSYIANSSSESILQPLGSSRALPATGSDSHGAFP